MEVLVREAQGLETETALKCYATARDLSKEIIDKNTETEILNRKLESMKADLEKCEQQYQE